MGGGGAAPNAPPTIGDPAEHDDVSGYTFSNQAICSN